MLPHRSLYTQQFLHADILTQRGLLTKKLFTQTPLHTEVFTQRRTYLHTDAVYKDVFALTKKRRIGVFAHKNLLETFAQNSFNTCFLHKKHLTKRNLYTQTAHKKITNRLFCTQQFTQKQFYTAFFLRTETFTQKNIFTTVFIDRRFLHTENFPHRKPTTEGFTHHIFYIQTLLHTDVFTQPQITHRNLCTQHAFTHNQFLHREALLPLLDHLPFVFPLSIFFAFVQTNADVRETENCQNRWWI